MRIMVWDLLCSKFLDLFAGSFSKGDLVVEYRGDLRGEAES